MISTILNGKRIFSFTGIKRLTRSTRAVIIPVEAKNDIIKTICDLSGSKKYAHGRLKQPANKVALTPMESEFVETLFASWRLPPWAADLASVRASFRMRA